jgi:hypothetical protein
MPVDVTPDKWADLFGCVHASSDTNPTLSTPPPFKHICTRVQELRRTCQNLLATRAHPATH